MKFSNSTVHFSLSSVATRRKQTRGSLSPKSSQMSYHYRKAFNTNIKDCNLHILFFGSREMKRVLHALT